ncbi:hypothetical protein CRG98_006184 [Punica granatum]|uniref:Uncharacterized protein n=1 Tax=Punica granatum TaxID=22663 RepID=A0A2I0KY71_PUNGR|nr:hypothetical protein CRG98_006184 [Punica granatum]
MNYRREVGSPRKAQEGNQKNRRTINPKNSRGRHYGTIHRRIAGASEGTQYVTLKIPLGTKMTHGASEHILEASCLSRGTPELSQTPFLTGLPGGPIHGQVNGTRKRACTHPRTTRTVEQVQTAFRGSSWSPDQLLSKILSTSPLPSNHHTTRAKANTGQNQRKTVRYSDHRPTRLKPNTTKLPNLHISHSLSPFPGLDFRFEASNPAFQPRTLSGPKDIPPVHPSSHTCHFLLQLWRVVPSRSKGSGMFDTIHERLDLSLRSPRNPTSLGAVAGASVPSSIFPGCHGRCLTGIYCPQRLAESSDSHCHFPDSFPHTSRLGNTPL